MTAVLWGLLRSYGRRAMSTVHRITCKNTVFTFTFITQERSGQDTSYLANLGLEKTGVDSARTRKWEPCPHSAARWRKPVGCSDGTADRNRPVMSIGCLSARRYDSGLNYCVSTQLWLVATGLICWLKFPRASLRSNTYFKLFPVRLSRNNTFFWRDQFLFTFQPSCPTWRS